MMDSSLVPGMQEPGAIEVVVGDAEGHPGVDRDALAALAARVLDAEGATGLGELSLSFVSEAEMAALNERYRGKEGPTDVLSFSLDDPAYPADPGVPLLLGDVVICPSVAAANAPAHGSSFEDEMALLVVHGVLHLLGMDHEDSAEAELMEGAETRHLEQFFRSTGGRGVSGGSANGDPPSRRR